MRIWGLPLRQKNRRYSRGYNTRKPNYLIISIHIYGHPRRLERLMEPFELRTAFARQRFTQLLMMEGEPPAAAIRLEHEDVAEIRRRVVARANANPSLPLALPRP